jgi:hypothetical protein
MVDFRKSDFIFYAIVLVYLHQSIRNSLFLISKICEVGLVNVRELLHNSLGLLVSKLCVSDLDMGKLSIKEINILETQISFNLFHFINNHVLP